MGHLLHHQGLALDEEMIHEERIQRPRAGARRPTCTARARRRGRVNGEMKPDRYAACVGRFYEDLAMRLE